MAARQQAASTAPASEERAQTLHGADGRRKAVTAPKIDRLRTRAPERRPVRERATPSTEQVAPRAERAFSSHQRDEQAGRNPQRFPRKQDQEREPRPLRTRNEFVQSQESVWQKESRVRHPRQQSIEEWESAQRTERPGRKAERKSPWWPEGFRTSERSAREEGEEASRSSRSGRGAARPHGQTRAKSRMQEFGAAELPYRADRPGRKKPKISTQTAKIKRKLDAKRTAKR